MNQFIFGISFFNGCSSRRPTDGVNIQYAKVTRNFQMSKK